MADSLLYQLKKRRLDLGLKQKDMMMRIGVSRQQYQRLESKGNPRLETLELISKGLNCELMLIPKEKLQDVQSILENVDTNLASKQGVARENKSLLDDPWQDILGEE